MSMKKTLLSIAILCCLTGAAAAQTRSRVFDNFDTSNGVQISVKPKIAQIPAVKTKLTKKGDKKLVQKTVQTTMNVTDGVALKNSSANVSYTKMVMSAGSGMSGFTTGDAVIDSYIVDSCKRYGIDPLLIYSQMHQESTFKITATSYKGARGLMQLMPGTAARFGVTNIYEPKQNIEGGVKYMRWLLNTFGGDVALALAAYNAGEGAVMKYGNQIPPYRETQEYVRRITARYSAVSNPNFVRSVKKVTNEQAVKLEKKEAKPLTVYEANALAIRMPDGRMRLVNQ